MAIVGNTVLVSSKAELQRREKEWRKAKSGGFESLRLHPNVYRGVKRKGYRIPTPIQRKTMPLILNGRDVVAMARTGSGKTAAFLVPMLQRLKQHVLQGGVRALILSPTRDLALQTLKFTKELGRYTDLRTSLLVGGDSMESQFEELAQSPDIIIATPGRLMHHLSEVDDMSLRMVEYVVFDEADSLFGMGFAEQLREILNQLREDRQTLLFSATLPSALAEFASAGLRNPEVVRLDLETRISPDLKVSFFTMRQEEKHAALLYLVREMIGPDEQTLVFVCTKHHVEFLNLLFREEGMEASVCYGDMDQDARKMNVSRFRARKTMVLIVTDVAARGIDIPLLDNVINWDFPPKPKIFVHRVGRAARAGRQGCAFSFVTFQDMPYLFDLHLFLSRPIKGAGTEEEMLQDMDGVLLVIKQADAKGETIYGHFPQAVIDIISDRFRELVDSSSELTSLKKACTNAFQLYVKTKPPPSRESVRRIKSLPGEGLHPYFIKSLGRHELCALAFSRRLKSFKPKQSIWEVEDGTSKQNQAMHEELISLVHKKQRRDDPVQQEVSRHPMENLLAGHKRKAQSFKDEEYFINAVPSNTHLEAGLGVRANEGFSSGRLKAAVLDLVADDGAAIQKQRSRVHWDMRRKRFVKLNTGERVTASGKIKTEGGSRVRARKSGIYQRWKVRSHSRVSDGHGREVQKRRILANAHLPSEVRDLEQVRKQRQRSTFKRNRGGVAANK